MNLAEYYRVNDPNVIHEVIDGEAVIVNLNNGNYYSTDQAGAHVWDMIERGTTVGHIVDAIANQYAGNREDIEDGVHQLLMQLQREGLIVTDKAPDSGGDASPEVASGAQAGKPVFEKPMLHRYTDMEDLLLLDPIHDVDETGWPNINPENG